jgi:hypothetical protein
LAREIVARRGSDPGLKRSPPRLYRFGASASATRRSTARDRTYVTVARKLSSGYAYRLTMPGGRAITKSAGTIGNALATTI